MLNPLAIALDNLTYSTRELHSDNVCGEGQTPKRDGCTKRWTRAIQRLVTEEIQAFNLTLYLEVIELLRLAPEDSPLIQGISHNDDLLPFIDAYIDRMRGRYSDDPWYRLIDGLMTMRETTTWTIRDKLVT